MNGETSEKASQKVTNELGANDEKLLTEICDLEKMREQAIENQWVLTKSWRNDTEDPIG
jgi:hypothetical protein